MFNRRLPVLAFTLVLAVSGIAGCGESTTSANSTAPEGHDGLRGKPLKPEQPKSASKTDARTKGAPIH